MAVRQYYLMTKRNNVLKRCRLKANGDKTLMLDDSLLPKYKLTVTTDPEGARVKLIADGYEEIGNEINVLPGTIVHWEVSKKHYFSKDDDILMDDNKSINVSLDPYIYNLVTEEEDNLIAENGDNLVSETY